MGMIFTADAMAEQLRRYNVNYDGRRTWDQLHLENQQYEAAGMGAIGQSLNSNLEQAYSSALSTQSAISGSRLGQGQKNLLNDQLWQATSQAYQTATSNAMTAQQKLNESVAQQAANIEGALLEQGDKTAKLLNSTVDYTSDLINNNKDLINDPLYAKYFVNLGMDALNDDEKRRYGELQGLNSEAIKEAKKHVEGVDQPGLTKTKNDIQYTINNLKSYYSLTRDLYHGRVKKSEVALTERTIANLVKALNREGYDLSTDPTEAIHSNKAVELLRDLGAKRDELELKLQNYHDNRLKANDDAVLLEGSEFDEYNALDDKVKGRAEGSRRAMSKDELMLQMFDLDDDGNWNMNISGQDFFDQTFNNELGDNSFGNWLKDNDSDLYDWFTSSSGFDVRGANQNQIRDMLGIGSNDYQYSFLERMGGMSKDQLRGTFDVFNSSVTAIATGNRSPENISQLTGNVTGLMKNLGLDADFERETGIKMADLSKGMDTVISGIIEGKDIQSAAAGTVIANIIGGAATGAGVGGWGGPWGALIGAIVGTVAGAVKGSIDAYKKSERDAVSNKNKELAVQREYNKMLNELTSYLEQRQAEANSKFEQTIRRF